MLKGFDILNLLVTLGTARFLGIHHHDLNSYWESDKTKKKGATIVAFFVHFLSSLII